MEILADLYYAGIVLTDYTSGTEERVPIESFVTTLIDETFSGDTNKVGFVKARNCMWEQVLDDY